MILVIKLFLEPLGKKTRETNRTDYNKLEHKAFVPQTTNTRIFEYIQAGKYLYFNAPINNKLEVSYRYLTKYVKVNALLRSNRIVSPKDTPILKRYTIRIRNSKI